MSKMADKFLRFTISSCYTTPRSVYPERGARNQSSAFSLPGAKVELHRQGSLAGCQNFQILGKHEWNLGNKPTTEDSLGWGLCQTESPECSSTRRGYHPMRSSSD